MNGYLHGAYSEISAVGTRVAAESESAIVYIGTAPVHLVEGGAQNVNKPIKVNNIAEARKYFGYDDNFASYTLCEAMNLHFERKGIGPLVFINVLNPEAVKSEQKVTQNLTPTGGKITIPNASNIYVDSVEVTGKTKGTDYSVAYDYTKKVLTISALSSGSLGTAAIAVKYYTVDPSSVTTAMVIGASDDLGTNTGIFAVKDVYPLTHMIPSFIACPGFSSVPAVHSAMLANSQKINGHWDAYLFVDLPIIDGETPVTLATAATWKNANGYTAENETVYFPLIKGTDGKTYHISVLAAANFQELLTEQDDIPYRTASNTEIALAQNLYFGAGRDGLVIDDELVNKYLNKNGIASAAFVGGRWVVWGAHSADYSESDANQINVSETTRMMLYYLGNDFQARRMADVDQPMTRNTLQSIVAEEQARIDALISIGALLDGDVSLDASADDRSDLMNGDFAFSFNVTTTPLAKSLTARVNWTDAGFAVYYDALAD